MTPAELLEEIERLEEKSGAKEWTVREYGDYDNPTLVIHSSDENRVCFMATAGSHGDPEKIESEALLIINLVNNIDLIKSALSVDVEAVRRSALEDCASLMDRFQRQARHWRTEQCFADAAAAIRQLQTKEPAVREGGRE